MPQAENEKKTENDDALRRFIDRLENWPEDEPPSPAELRALRREIRLSEEDREKLELLAENHIRRARHALAGSAYDQAAAELARASQLRPMDARPRVELAGIYLQRSLERGYGRNDRQRALKLAHKALELNPGDMEAKQFLHDYRRMNADFLAVKYKRFIIPVLISAGLITAMIWWQKDWVLNLFSPRTSSAVISSADMSGTAETDTRDVQVDAAGINGGNLKADIISATVGHRNDDSYVNVLGRLNINGQNLGELDLVLRGRDSGGETLFTIPWKVRDESDPVLIPGDSQSLVLFRWLADPETSIESLEISSSEIEEMEISDTIRTIEPEIIWHTPRPEGVTLAAEIRNFETIEAYDRQILHMDLAVKNEGLGEISNLTLAVSPGTGLPAHTEYALSGTDPPLIRGERRVWDISMGIPLDTDISDIPFTVYIEDIVN